MSLWTDIRGNVAIIFTLSLPVLLVCSGLAVDYAVWTNQKQELQRIADEAALIAAKELYLANTSGSQAAAVAQASATNSIVAAGMSTAASPADRGDKSNPSDRSPSGNRDTTFGDRVTVHTTVDLVEGTVEVTVTQAGVALFSKSMIAPPLIRVSAVARSVGGGRVCVIGLHESEAGTITLDSNAILTAATCGVYSNSTSADGVSSNSNAVLTSELTCSAGGYDGKAYNFAPPPVTDCPKIPDPLASRPAPPVGRCDYKNREVIDKRTNLHPGVYCGGLFIDGNSDVRLNPGVYVIKDGEFRVDSNSKIRGTEVGFYLLGADSVFRFSSNAVVDLSAPVDGPLAGILFFEDRSAPLGRAHEIFSNYARNLVGTVYLPRGRFVIDADTPVADLSAYTAIIALKVELYSGPNLVLNTDYGLTDVPLPDGINRAGGNIVLTR